ncbi:predicted protein [Chaetoceros tenuissimus]|uniref:MACPF domain-containing protein n=1 Tax=Chaetoceros tenuissimus TaxID=426638 RepID=A0AAD3CG17_9STRA|nr:predicted protein [Chaetoceros tenuissimus]
MATMMKVSIRENPQTAAVHDAASRKSLLERPASGPSPKKARIGMKAAPNAKGTTSSRELLEKSVGISADNLVLHFTSGFECEKTAGGFNQSPMLPLPKKKVARGLFDAEKIANCMEWMQDDHKNLWHDTEESLKDLKETFQGFAGYHRKLTDLSIRGMFGLTTESTTESFYHSTHHRRVYGFVNLDLEGSGSHLDFLTKSAKSKIESINSTDKAKDFIRTYGIGYINQIAIGVAYTKVAKARKHHYLTKSDFEMQINKNSAMSNMTGDIEFNLNINGKQVSCSVKVEKFGSPKKDDGSWDEYLKSDGGQPTVIGYDFEPVFSLCDDEKYTKQKGYLEKAYYDMIAKAPPLPGVGTAVKDTYEIEVQRRRAAKDYIRLYYGGGNRIGEWKVTDKQRNDFLKKVNKSGKRKHWAFCRRDGSTDMKSFQCEEKLTHYNDLPSNLF